MPVHSIIKLLKWTSTDVIRTCYVEVSYGTVILRVGVMPVPSPTNRALTWPSNSKRLLLDYGTSEIDVEILQSETICSAGPQLLQSTFNIGPMVDVREPFTTTLGITICARSTPWIEGTGSFFLDEGGDGKRLLPTTACDVVFCQADSNLFERK